MVTRRLILLALAEVLLSFIKASDSSTYSDQHSEISAPYTDVWSEGSESEEPPREPTYTPLSPKNMDPQSSDPTPELYTLYDVCYPKKNLYQKIEHSQDMDYSRFALNPYEDNHESYQIRKQGRAYDLWHYNGSADTINDEATDDDAKQEAMKRLIQG